MLIGSWTPPLPAVPTRAVVVAPHPDDEVLGCGMLMRWLADRGCELSVVACTDGEASHPRSAAITPHQLRRRRVDERARAFELLGITPSVTRLGLPDGALGEAIDQLADALADLVGGADVLVAPWRGDDHPDHIAATLAATEAAARTGAPVWQVPIWGKVRRSCAYGERCARLRLTPAARRAKATAAAAFVSQLAPVGPGRHDGPVVHPAELDAMLDGEELVLW